MLRIALVSALQFRALDTDLAPLAEALRAAGMEPHVVCWDEPADWSRFDLLLLRSTWDYMSRLPEFLAWAERVSGLAPLRNSLATVRWNIDKHYLGDLAAAGVPVVATVFLEPGAEVGAAIDRFLATDTCAEFVIKPAVGVGSRDAQRHVRTARAAAVAHAARVLDGGYSVLLQPYLASVDEEGEAALIFFAGPGGNARFSHSIRKDALLRRDGSSTAAVLAPETIRAREARDDELAVAQQALAAVPSGLPLYARVDLIRDSEKRPRVLELELIEPSLFFAHEPEAPARFAACIARELRRA